MPTWRMGKTCWFCGDLSACWCGEVAVGGGCVVASLCMVPCSVTVGLGRLFAATVSTVPGRWHVTGALVAALPAVPRVVVHDSRPASFP